MALKSGITGVNATQTAFQPIATAQPVGSPIPFVDPNSFEADPLYQQIMAQASGQFNNAKANALADIQDTETGNKVQLAGINKSAAESRNRLAGNYAARGMAGGTKLASPSGQVASSGGALAAAELELNARQLASQTSLVDQITALNKNFNRNFGAVGTDWRGTTTGQEFIATATQEALNQKLAGLGVAR